MPMALTDVYEVAVLKVKGIHYTEIAPSEDKVRFIYPDTVGQDLKDFYEGKLQVSARDFKHAIEDVRSIIYGLRKSAGIEKHHRKKNKDV